MNNRIVRWIIYFVVGVTIGLGVSYFHKQQKMGEGVVALSPDEAREEGIEIPSRSEEMSDEDSVMEGIMDKVEESMEETGKALQEGEEAAMNVVEDIMKETKEIMSSEETIATEAIEVTPEESAAAKARLDEVRKKRRERHAKKK